jgi:hypothetical protein
MVNNNAREWGILMAWVVRKHKSLMFAGTTASDALQNFLEITAKEPKHIVARAVQQYSNGSDKIRVNSYTLKWE